MSSSSTTLVTSNTTNSNVNDGTNCGNVGAACAAYSTQSAAAGTPYSAPTAGYSSYPYLSMKSGEAQRAGRQLNPYVFTDEHGNPMHPDTYTKRLRRLYDRSGFPKEYHLHTLRHYFVSTLLHGGVDKQTVAELAGHGDTSFLERTYCHPQMSLKYQAASVMYNSLLSGDKYVD